MTETHYAEIMQELKSAKEKYPIFPADIIHRVAIMCEESGEAMQAALNHVYHQEPISHLRSEVIQAAAMCFRILESIDNMIPHSGVFDDLIKMLDKALDDK